ncbi:hypothetical protein C7U92_18395 [Bradyrhizobium sp. WBOS7]|uniref:Uncharacterized protein n=1 Tax=Bradyrhizobium betae TaxID=244734 RepID=A0AAE9N779_9BRAD|nr:hypothetical protein [Bradyrhizobium sp. WBOS2]MDD1572762.1 hypothetical protein [Bradyrhizobium sp. WBOS1]MDD1578681.1 hypothetical protein [Bradyrhizobium sp. WBOS7]MDD1603243.1 hypothetical protein [Bradyrhizobium sp. WBOS16]UUO33604.1 hypothetical protein DCK84_02775 [Bradyrhizobium sp. WBOS01]UUO39800.1 hypothetical protein DCM75_02860 [Bradyrhizobium sp. WBOS02]UUO52012.1 hypothetical protein DCM79_02765 [Bradyrhizobium sp. WBOS07]UUO64307.1 hypothetical protein DCM83_03100 [Bradyrh
MAAMYEFLRALTALRGGFLARCGHYPHCHSPRKRGIQYAAAHRSIIAISGILGRPVEPGDDSGIAATPPPATPAPSSVRSRTQPVARTGSAR